MALAAKISSAELTAQVANRFQDQYFEAALVNAPGTTYQPGITDDATFMGFEVVDGTAGYRRQVIQYVAADIGAYADDGVGLATKATVFAHDGGGTAMQFSHAVLLWGGGNVTALGAVTSAPSAGVNGTYTNIPIDATDGSGTGMTVDLVIANLGAASTDYTLTIANAGSGYAAADSLTILDDTLTGLGVITSGAGNLGFTVGAVSSSANAGQVVAVAQTSNSVSLSAGNEAAFYWNLKQFGFYNP